MKSLPAIGFLLLLLYHWIGLPLAVLTFEQDFQQASLNSPSDEFKLIKLPISLPYTSAWENPDGREGLIQVGDDFYNVVHQRYANDTLYTLLKTNQNARDRFFELAEQLQQFSNDQDTPLSPLNRLLKLLNERLTNYLLPASYQLGPLLIRSLPENFRFSEVPIASYRIDRAPTSPPPQG